MKFANEAATKYYANFKSTTLVRRDYIDDDGAMSKIYALYDRDFVLWSEEQAARLRDARDSNLGLDWEHLAEEIESSGKSDRRSLASQIRRIIHHLLKIEASPAGEPRAGWRSTIRNARAEIAHILRDSPSLGREVDAMVAEEIETAAKLAEDDLAQHGDAAAKIRARLRRGVFTAGEVFGDWFPDPRG